MISDQLPQLNFSSNEKSFLLWGSHLKAEQILLAPANLDLQKHYVKIGF